MSFPIEYDYTEPDKPKEWRTYQRQLPEPYSLVTDILLRKPGAKLEDYQFIRIDPPHSQDKYARYARHSVVVRPLKAVAPEGMKVIDLRFNVFHRRWTKLVELPDGSFAAGRDEWWVEPNRVDMVYGN
jgi:hypothetical protein